MPKLSEVTRVLEDLAPLRHAEPWDNVGLLVGDPEQSVRKAIFTIDYSDEVAEERQREGCELVVAYHPPIFHAIKRVTAGSVAFEAIRGGVAIYSPHTALDVADGGTNDMLADALGMEDRQPLRMTEGKATQYKLVVFVPEEAAEKAAAALFAAGAGRIGNYTSCSFRSPGTGTFFGEDGTNPAVGSSHRLETVQELRIETVLPIHRVEGVIRALRENHPYEEPAFDLVQLAAPPEGKGQGRIGELKKPATRREIIERVKRELGLAHLLIGGPTEGEARRVACCAGSCGDLLDDALAQNAEVYLTGEMRHHDALKAAQRGVTVICTLHSNSERGVLKRFAKRVNEKLPSIAIHISAADRDPFSLT